ncbi:MAG: NUDIX hydrolase [Hyphomicrobiales bacterium]|nr:NUDIX hydrolase [Hyphomicrobiales bacterium]
MSTQSGRIIPIAHVDARQVSYDWPFKVERKADIAAHWAGLTASKPAIFNGQVLLQCQGAVEGGRFVADYFQTDYASFIAWNRWGFPATDGALIRNGFAMGALRSRDGAFLMGVMGAHTANAGRIYFAAGTPDPSDVTADGKVDLAGSLLRELEEETGLARGEVTVGDDWRIVPCDARVAFLRDVLIDLPATEARALIRDRLARQTEPELSDIMIARSEADIDTDRMPVFMQTFLKDAFSKR